MKGSVGCSRKKQKEGEQLFVPVHNQNIFPINGGEVVGNVIIFLSNKHFKISKHFWGK